MVCPKCKSENVQIIREASGEVSGSHTAVKGKRGCLYYLLVAWWIWIFKLLLLPFTIFKRKKIATVDSVSATKNTYQTTAVCQNCGYTWKTSKK